MGRGSHHCIQDTGPAQQLLLMSYRSWAIRCEGTLPPAHREPSVQFKEVALPNMIAAASDSHPTAPDKHGVNTHCNLHLGHTAAHSREIALPYTIAAANDNCSIAPEQHDVTQPCCYQHENPKHDLFLSIQRNTM